MIILYYQRIHGKSKIMKELNSEEKSKGKIPNQIAKKKSS